MSQQQLYQFVAGIVPSWRRSQLKVLALCVQALVVRHGDGKSRPPCRSPSAERPTRRAERGNQQDDQRSICLDPGLLPDIRRV